jgi:hypothetical protein
MLAVPAPAVMAPVGDAQAVLGNVNKVRDDMMDTGQTVAQIGNQQKEDMGRWSRFVKNTMEKHATKIQAILKFTAAFNKTMMMIARFYPLIVLVLIVLAFFGKPLEYIMLFLAGIIISIIWIIVFIFGLDVLRVVPYLFYNMIMVASPTILFALVSAGIFLILLIICLILGAINKATGGSLKHLILCQNSPEAWFKIGSFQHKNNNKYQRGFFCSKPCAKRYKPDDLTGDFCEKLPSDVPGFCPNAQVMRLYTGFKRNDSPYTFKTYNTRNPKYYSRTPLMREELLRDSFFRKKEIIEKCQKPMQQYNDLTLNICSSTDTYLKSRYAGMDDAAINKLRNVCGMAFCSASSNYPFCNKLNNSSMLDSSEFVKQVIKIITAIILFFVLLIFTFNFMFNKDI